MARGVGGAPGVEHSGWSLRQQGGGCLVITEGVQSAPGAAGPRQILPPQLPDVEPESGGVYTRARGGQRSPLLEAGVPGMLGRSGGPHLRRERVLQPDRGFVPRVSPVRPGGGALPGKTPRRARRGV